MVAYSLPKVDIVVESVSGNQLQISVERNSNVLGLKHKMAKVWAIPPLCQNVALGTEVLADVELFENLRPANADSPLSLTMVVSLKQLYEQIQSPNHRLREAAVEALAQVAHRDYERAVASLTTCTRDRITEVRLAAVETLGKVSEPGEQVVLEALKYCHSDINRDVRFAALDAIDKLALWEQGDVSMDIVRPYLSAQTPAALRLRNGAQRTLHDSDTRQAAVELLGNVLQRGHTFAVQPLVESLTGDTNAAVRVAAVEALSSIVAKRMPIGINPDDHDQRARALSVDALATAAENDSDTGVRQSASKALEANALERVQSS